MHTARIVFCFALLGLAGPAGAEDTPYKHEYLNGGYFEGAPEAGNPARPDDEKGTDAETPSSYANHHNTPANAYPGKQAIVAGDCN
ncbi:hypothetical protein [Thiobacillus sp.]|uniref:hypothetical protein n=1 Tax=Thiobacillus sp. TaxID=924 RepID=UPI0025E923AC|nr:hypothetical protein [Thiobacillus sp.]MBT9538583.1 hypothetical protein [Thiobacillus sp.]